MAGSGEGDDADVERFLTVAALANTEVDASTVVEGLEPVVDDDGEVDEEVLGAIVGGDESVATTRVEELDRALGVGRIAGRDRTARVGLRRRLAGEITEDEFKPLRLQNGLYMQLHAYMLRVAIPYGLISSAQMRMLAHIARKYDRDYGHFTTRQNIQYNWIKLEECADILEELATVEMHAIQTSGNCIRNISSDQYAGAAADEVVDPRPWAELLRQWSTFHPEFSYLPRKFKIAVIASAEDRAAMRLHDIGLELIR